MSNEKVSPGFLLTVAVLGSTLLGAAYFIYYFHVIGRSDLVMSVLLDNSRSLHIFSFLMALGGIALTLHLVPSFLLYVVFGLFKELGTTEESAFNISGSIFFFGITLLIGSGAFWAYRDYPTDRLDWLAVLLLLCIWVGCAVFFYIFRELSENYGGKIKQIGIITFSSLIAFMGVLFSGFIMKNFLRYGVGEDLYLVAVGFFFSLSTIFPGAAWIAARDKGNKKQLSMGLITSLSILFLFVFMAPDTGKVMVFNAGKAVGLHSDKARQYALIASDENTDRLSLIWPNGMIDENGTFLGKQLFSMGGVELVCPIAVAISPAEIITSKRGLGVDCILLRSHQVIKGSADLSNGEENAGDE